ncbi:MAG: type II secretion system F family protein [Anaerovibrio sp.]|uniref:type II secretion system F family protein n=1 Tax=Anaerovibrio sp. TaxID=1872532 RepID=UPI002620DB83|nr:type II secretion system F family protein [Anaerovibrio sp.]MDD7677049.1 type II secretion system F family protein [Anaerovibrio sp.]MDY2603330.1 type II secretion system F family protein [Anaerovibrio sp.]
MLVAVFSLSVALLVFAILYAVIKAKVVPQQELNERLKALDEGYEGKKIRRTDDNKDEIPGFRERVVTPLGKYLGNLITRLAPAAWSVALERKLVTAGKGRVWTAQGYAVFWVIVVLVVIVIAIKYVYGRPDLAPVQLVMVMILFTAMGAALPWIMLRIMAQKRQKLITKQLPEVLDLLCVSVQAGLSFDAALRRIVERMKGPLIEECTRMLEDVRMGLPRRQALRMMGERCEVQEVALFVTAIIQAERLGTSLGKTLNNQAINMRERRRQTVKAEAMKAPVKMIFPLVLFIFPSVFVIVLLPALLNMMKNFIK